MLSARTSTSFLMIQFSWCAVLRNSVFHGIGRWAHFLTIRLVWEWCGHSFGYSNVVCLFDGSPYTGCMLATYSGCYDFYTKQNGKICPLTTLWSFVNVFDVVPNTQSTMDGKTTGTQIQRPTLTVIILFQLSTCASFESSTSPSRLPGRLLLLLLLRFFSSLLFRSLRWLWFLWMQTCIQMSGRIKYVLMLMHTNVLPDKFRYHSHYL